MEENIIRATIDALLSVRHPRFFQNERGYHGRFYCFLQGELEKYGFLQGNDIIEMEYQKSQRHNLRQRPDIIFHIPAEVSKASVTENNYAVWALKPDANAESAKDDFQKLDQMFATLHYPLGVFINIRSEIHHFCTYSGPHVERLHAFAVALQDDAVTVRHAFLRDGSLAEETICR